MNLSHSTASDVKNINWLDGQFYKRNLTIENKDPPKVVIVHSFNENDIKKDTNAILVQPESNPYYEDGATKDANTHEFENSVEKLKIIDNVYYE